MLLCRLLTVAAVLLSILCHIQGRSVNELSGLSLKPSSPFDSALEFLQKQINYTFQTSDLLRRAMTHSSYSNENNKALAILGSNVIDTAVAFQLLEKNIEISPKDLSRRISEISSVESSCAVDAVRLGLQKVVRVSPRLILPLRPWFAELSDRFLARLVLIPGDLMSAETFSGRFMVIISVLLCLCRLFSLKKLCRRCIM